MSFNFAKHKKKTKAPQPVQIKAKAGTINMHVIFYNNNILNHS